MWGYFFCHFVEHRFNHYVYPANIESLTYKNLTVFIKVTHVIKATHLCITACIYKHMVNSNDLVKTWDDIFPNI